MAVVDASPHALGVIVLHQAQAPPSINGIQKPPKPGGYSDSSADIAFALARPSVTVITPVDQPNPLIDLDWSFPDTASGIRAAVEKARKVLPQNIVDLVVWANVVLFADHPLVPTLRSLCNDGDRKLRMRVVGQEPGDTEKYDDKEVTNDLLRSHNITAPRVTYVAVDEASRRSSGDILLKDLSTQRLSLPLIVKPIRGRGSQGVSRVLTYDELHATISALFSSTFTSNGKDHLALYGNRVIVEEFLSGDEYTVTVMPPGRYVHDRKDGVDVKPTHWALPPVRRGGHVGDVMPYSGNVPVAHNSRVVSHEELIKDSHLQKLCRECEQAASLLSTRAPLRIDARRRGESGEVVLFDVNMKPNMTGPGRSGREEQASLVGLAAEAIGWDYARLVFNIASQAWLIE